MDTDLSVVAQAVMPTVMEVREHLHANPYTRWEEDPSLSYIEQRVKEFASSRAMSCYLEVCQGFKGGLVVNVMTKKSSSNILLRADIDALPVVEDTGLSCASERLGYMHACGHDIHSAMLLGAFQAVMSGAVEPKHNLSFVWQRAEENPGSPPDPVSGGDMLVREGVCEGISAAYGLHIWNSPQSGTPGVFLSRPGGFLGNSGRMKFTICSSGGHVAMPHGGINALRVALAVLERLGSFIVRHLPPTEPATLEPTGVRAGNGLASSNVMPKEAELTLGFRTVLPRNLHESMMKKIAEEASSVCSDMGAKLADLEIVGGHPALINTPEQYTRVSKLLQDSGELVQEHPIILGGEDFAHYLYKVPGAMFMLGAHTPGSGDHHSPTFNPDPSVFWRGVKFWLTLITN